MTGSPSAWTPDPFTTDAEQRSDGSILLRPLKSLDDYPVRTMDALEHWARTTPDRVFIARRGSDGQWQELTYAQVLARVQRIAEGLLDRDLSPERPIAILSGNSIEHLSLAFAATWAGIPYCPVSPAYSLSAGELNKLRYVLNLLTPGLIAAFGTAPFARALTEVADASVELVTNADFVHSRPTSTLAQIERTPSARLVEAHAHTNADSIVKFLLTSGSTGDPKAVITTERMLCSNATMLRQALPFLIDEPPVLVDWLPWNHTFGGSHNVGLVLFNGGSLYIDDGKPTPAGFATTLRNLRDISPTVYFNVPKGFDALAHALQDDAQLRHVFYRRLQAYFFAGASLPQHTRDTLDRLSITERGFRVPMISGIGATETGPSVTFTTPAAEHTSIIGLPAAGNLVKLTPLEGKLELRVRSPSVTPGYWRRPDLTTACFDEEGFYRLGDAVRLIDPAHPTRGLIFDGRIAEDFKLASGTWVSVGPLRALLIGALSPLIQDVGIAGLDREFLTAVLIPDVAACAEALGLTDEPSHAQLADSETLLELLRQRLEAHASRFPASSMNIRRAILVRSPLSIDHGEITDKGSVNQRALLQRRGDQVAAMYEPETHTTVIRIR
ncbi:feruloyl-CoA synthase [Povalibacter sp.]|uniref:feruloyl-CoA synthase n=1 Tax=Povalibacter sp. TaxID=1962978 RepID=UPI002F401B04